MPEDFKIVRIQESFRIDDGGETRQTKQILYRVGTDGPFSIEIPADEFTPERAREILELEVTKLREIRALKA